jgi:hypothetical protein
MSDEPIFDSAVIRMGAWIVASVLALVAFGLILRLWDRTAEVAPAPVAMMKLLPRDELHKRAIAEVKRREGWTGIAGDPDQEGYRFYFAVRRDRKGLAERGVVVEGSTGAILDYEVLR